MKHKSAALSPLLIPLALAGFAFVLAPLVALVVRVPWSAFYLLITSASAHDAIKLSLLTCTLATLSCIALGTPLATWTARSDSRAAQWTRNIIRIPLVLPPVVAGLVLLQTWGRYGMLGYYLDTWFGIRIAFSTLAVIIAQTFVALPFYYLALDTGMRAQGGGLEQEARRLGASAGRTFWSITLPVAMPSIAAGAALAFARAMGEFGATLTFAGSLQGVTQTLPLQIYQLREEDTDLALALSVVLLLLSGFIALAARALTPLARRIAATIFARSDRKIPANLPRLNLEEVARLGGTQDNLGPRIEVRAAIRERGVNLDLALPGGKISTVVGPNGAGKSTLLQLISADLQADDGGVVFMPDTPRPREIAFLQQQPVLFPHLSCLANLVFAMRAQQLTHPKYTLNQLAYAALQALDVAAFANSFPQQLSGGQLQRVALARVLLTRPRVILLDEPLAALDAVGAEQMRALIPRVQAATGATCVLVTHDIRDVASLSDHLVVLRDGKVLRTGTVEQILAMPGIATEHLALHRAWRSNI